MSALFQGLAALAVAVAVGWVLWPIAREGRRGVYTAMVISAWVITAGLYRLLGTPAALDPAATASAPQTLEDGVRQLQQALRNDPQRGDGWALLGRSLSELQQLPQAADAYERAVALLPEDPALLAEAAQARANAHPQRRFDDTAVAWLQKARVLAPAGERAGWLLGIAQRQRGQHAQAAATWASLLPTLSPDAAAALREQIALAHAAAGDTATAPASPAAPTPASSAPLLVRVALDEDFAARARLDPNATVFVIARVPGGSPMPVAVEKHAVTDLPLLVSLDDADSPMPTARLSALSHVEVIARLSPSGQAARQPDDLESAPVQVTLPAAAPVQIRLGAASDTP